MTVFAIPNLPRRLLSGPLPGRYSAALSREEKRIAGQALLVGLGAGVATAAAFVEAMDSLHPAYELGALAGTVGDRLRDRAVAEARQALDLPVTSRYSLSIGEWPEPEHWVLQGGERLLSLRAALALPPELQRPLALSLTLIDRLLVRSIWPSDIGESWMVEELAGEWESLTQASGESDPEKVAAWAANRGEEDAAGAYYFDASDPGGCEWAAAMSALHADKPRAGSARAGLYRPDYKTNPWRLLGQLERLVGALPRQGAGPGPQVAWWCGLVARAVGWHTGGKEGERRAESLKRACGYREEQELEDNGLTPLAEGSVIVLDRESEIEVVQRMYEGRMEAGETAGLLMRVGDPVAGGQVIYRTLRGVILGGWLLDQLGEVLEGIG